MSEDTPILPFERPVPVDIEEEMKRSYLDYAMSVIIGRALPVDQHQTHGEVLRHAHQGVVDRLVAVRVIFAHHVADHARRFHIFLVGRMALLVHRVENAPVHGLEAVTRIRQRTRHDHAHRVIEIAALHLLDDGNGAHIGGGCVPRFGRFGVGQGDVLRGIFVAIF